MADRAMYILGPILITLAAIIIVGLTYVYFYIVLPMMSGTNWIVTVDDYHAYWNGGQHQLEQQQSDTTNNTLATDKISTLQSIILAIATLTGIFHTTIVTFFLINIIYNYYQCVTTSNSGISYNIVVRELAENTPNFNYPESEEELLQCKRDLERRIAEKLEVRRRELMAASAAAASSNNGDEESATNNNNNNTTTRTTTSSPQPIPRIYNWQLLSPTEWSYCRYSKQPKPPRSHYDHVTKSLILNMDHYCPWMFNCVGYFNYRYFVNFLFYVTTGLFYGSLICLRPFMYMNGEEYREQVRQAGGVKKALREITVRHMRDNSYIPTPDERTPVALGFMLCVCLCCAVGCLLGFHIYLSLTAQTTIEFHGNWAKRRRVKKGGMKWKNPYSTGHWKRNWEMIYGTRYHEMIQKERGGEIGADNGVDVTSSQHDHERYSYRGCWGMLMAMMPSNREPEFLPLPFDGVLIRRKTRANSSLEVDKKIDEEMAGAEAESSSSSNNGLSWDNNNEEDEDLLAAFRKKSPARNTTELTDRTGRSRGEEVMV
jgi:hypothetical protein